MQVIIWLHLEDPGKAVKALDFYGYSRYVVEEKMVFPATSFHFRSGERRIFPVRLSRSSGLGIRHVSRAPEGETRASAACNDRSNCDARGETPVPRH